MVYLQLTDIEVEWNTWSNTSSGLMIVYVWNRICLISWMLARLAKLHSVWPQFIPTAVTQQSYLVSLKIRKIFVLWYESA